MSESNSNAPQLQAPGAGLPKLELLIGKFLFRRYTRRASMQDLAERLELEQRKLRHLLADLDPQDRRKQVLIPRIRGIEDSSRFWSVDMALQHLVITTKGMFDIAKALTANQSVSQVVRIEDVKPSVNPPPDVEAAFFAIVEALRTYLEAIPKPPRTLTHTHPWFGPLDAFSWYSLAVTHIGIHRRQMKAIKAAL